MAYVRGLTKDDLEDVKILNEAALDQIEAGLSGIDEDEVLDLEEESDYYFGVFEDGKMVGLCTLGGADPYYDKGSILSDLIVLPEHQGKGYGTLLVKEVIGKCDELPIYVDCLNNQHAFYERIGFEISLDDDCEMVLTEKNKDCVNSEYER